MNAWLIIIVVGAASGVTGCLLAELVVKGFRALCELKQKRGLK